MRPSRKPSTKSRKPFFQQKPISRGTFICTTFRTAKELQNKLGQRTKKRVKAGLKLVRISKASLFKSRITNASGCGQSNAEAGTGARTTRKRCGACVHEKKKKRKKKPVARTKSTPRRDGRLSELDSPGDPFPRRKKGETGVRICYAHDGAACTRYRADPDEQQQVNAIWRYQTPKLSCNNLVIRSARRQHVAARAVRTSHGQQPTPVPTTSLPFFITIIKLLFFQSSKKLKRHLIFLFFFFVPVLREDTCFSPISCAGCTTTKGYWLSRGKKIGFRR